MQTELTVRWGRGFTEAMAGVRRDGWFAGQVGAGTDDFDAVGYHLVVAVAGAPVGLVRTTVGPPSVLQAWSGGRCPLPRGATVAELTRGVVAPAVRRLGIYRLAMLESLLRLRALGATVATGAVEPDFVGRRFLAGVGFVEVGAPALFDDHPRKGTLAQCLVLPLDAWKEASWNAMRRTLVGELTACGYRVDSDLESWTETRSALT
jgi:hypothetical protein